MLKFSKMCCQTKIFVCIGLNGMQMSQPSDLNERRKVFNHIYPGQSHLCEENYRHRSVHRLHQTTCRIWPQIKVWGSTRLDTINLLTFCFQKTSIFFENWIFSVRFFVVQNRSAFSGNHLHFAYPYFLKKNHSFLDFALINDKFKRYRGYLQYHSTPIYG